MSARPLATRRAPFAPALTLDSVGGVWRSVLDLAVGLRARGARPRLVHLGPEPSPDQRAEVLAAGLPLIETRAALDWTARDEAELKSAARMVALHAEGCDLIHLHAPALAGFGPLGAPTTATAHSCLGTWWAAVRGGPAPDEFAWRMAAHRRGLRSVRVRMAPTAAFARAANRIDPGFAFRIAPNGIARGEPELSPAPRDGVLAAGRLWDDGKNFATIARVATKRGIPIRAAGPRIGPLGQSFDTEGLDWRGPQTPWEMHDLYARASIFFAPALYEPFGLCALEAARAGCALVLSDIGSFRELWGAAAVFRSPRDVEGFGDVIAALLDDPSACAALGAKARAQSERLSTEAMVDAVLAAYAEALGRAPLPDRSR